MIQQHESGVLSVAQFIELPMVHLASLQKRGTGVYELVGDQWDLPEHDGIMTCTKSLMVAQRGDWVGRT